jgi:hypothetical protein
MNKNLQEFHLKFVQIFRKESSELFWLVPTYLRTGRNLHDPTRTKT